MSRNTAIAIIIFVIAALGIIGAYYLSQRQTINFPQSSLTASPVEGFPTTESSPPTTQPESGTDTLDSDNIALILIEPYDQSEISSPVKISGFLNVTNNPTTLNVKDPNGKILGTGSAESCQEEDGCFFEIEVNFEKSETSTGTIEAIASSSNNLLQSVAVKFK